jgi:hypothetical protein
MSAHGAQINFGDLASYLTYDVEQRREERVLSSGQNRFCRRTGKIDDADVWFGRVKVALLMFSFV